MCSCHCGPQFIPHRTVLQSGETVKDVISFLVRAFEILGSWKVLKTDHSFVSTAKSFQEFCQQYALTHTSSISYNPHGQFFCLWKNLVYNLNIIKNKGGGSVVWLFLIICYGSLEKFLFGQWNGPDQQFSGAEIMFMFFFFSCRVLKSCGDTWKTDPTWGRWTNRFQNVSALASPEEKEKKRATESSSQ